jgi:hypothetical protein
MQQQLPRGRRLITICIICVAFSRMDTREALKEMNDIGVLDVTDDQKHPMRGFEWQKACGSDSYEMQEWQK